LGVFPSDMLPTSVTQSGTVIINADPHMEKGSYWLASHFPTKILVCLFLRFVQYRIGLAEIAASYDATVPSGVITGDIYRG